MALAVLLTACGIGPNDPDASETAGASAPPHRHSGERT